ncbi:MAG: hypothetical protein J7L94_13290, partial [Caldisericaceae bacterium]|nr:hypothetical protein [Caldisericaceae bacterium]
LAYDFEKGEKGGFSSPDLTIMAEDITKSGILQIAYQQLPVSRIWIVLNNGKLLALTYHRDAKIVAWQTITTKSGDKFERIACIPGTPDDEVWVVVVRTINGQTVRYLECLQPMFTDTGAEFTTNKGLNAFFVDSGYTYNGTPTKTVTGLSHLEGETVSILANGIVQNQQIVQNGQITIPDLNVFIVNTENEDIRITEDGFIRSMNLSTAKVIHIGLPYSGVLRTLRINAQLPDGSMQAREKRIVDIFARVKDSGSFIAGRDGENYDLVQDPNQQDVYGEPFPLFTGDLQIRYEGQYDKAGQVYVAQTNPLPLTLLALYPEVQTA